MDVFSRRRVVCACAVALVGAGLFGGPMPTNARIAPNSSGTWTPIAVPPLMGLSPTSIAFDPVHHQLIAEVVNGKGSAATAVLNGSSWTVVAPPGGDVFDQLPLVFDPALDEVVAVSEECVVIWTGAAWSAPPCRFLGGAPRAAGYDGHLRAVIVTFDTFECVCGSASGFASQYADTETWAWSGATLSRLHPVDEPNPIQVEQPNPFNGCMSDPTCIILNTYNNPVFAEVGAATWDATHDRLVLVGDGNRTWTWDGSDWSGGTVVDPADTPPSIAYDPAIGTDLSFGYPQRTAKWTGNAWETVTTTGFAPAADPITYDPDLGTVVILGSALAGGPLKLWEFTPGLNP